MKVFVTGGSGFLGKVVIRQLKEVGHEVFALARSEEAKTIVEKLGAVAVKGQLQEIVHLRSQLEQVDAVVHCAAPVEFWGPWGKFFEGITQATMRLANLANDAGVKRFVHISSESVLQDKEPLLDIDESFPYPEEPNSYYGKAKKLAEEQLLNADFKMEVVILRPTFIWGEDCPAFDAIESKVRSKQFVWVDGGRSEFEAVHIENVARAVVLGISRGKDKGVYFITDEERTTVREFFEQLFKVRRLSIPSLSLPGWAARPIANLCETIWRIFHFSGVPPLTRFDLAFVSQPRRYNTGLSRQELGYKPIISRAEAWKRASLALETSR